MEEIIHDQNIILEWLERELRVESVHARVRR